MEEIRTRSYGLAKKLSQLFDLESKIDTVLSVSMYYLNQLMDTERSSIFLYQQWTQKLTVFSSLDLDKHEIDIPISCGLAGWVFSNREPAIVNNAYEDWRFCKEVDTWTGFHTCNLVCVPLIDTKPTCLGTLQSLNKKKGRFAKDDLELLELAAGMVVVAIKNSKLYSEILTTNEFRKKIINKITDEINNVWC